MYSDGQLVAYVDDDALPIPMWLSSLYRCYSSTNAAAVGGPVIASRKSERARLDHSSFLHAIPLAIFNEDTYQTGRIYRSGLVTENWDSRGSGVRQVDSLVGTNMSYSRDWLEKVGLFDERINSLRDETDVCLSLTTAGGKILFSHDAPVYHKVSAEGWPAKRQYRKYFDDFYFLSKHAACFNPIRFFARESLFLLYLLARSLPFGSKSEEYKYALRGRLDAYRRFGRLIPAP